MGYGIVVDDEPRPDFFPFIKHGEPTFAIAWRGDAAQGCGSCGCGECQGPTTGCSCSDLPFGHLDLNFIPGWKQATAGGCGASCAGSKGGRFGDVMVVAAGLGGGSWWSDEEMVRRAASSMRRWTRQDLWFFPASPAPLAPPPPLDPLQNLPLVPDAGIDESPGGREIPTGLDCFKAWLEWLDTLSEVDRALAEKEGSGCWPWIDDHAIIDSSVFLPWAPCERFIIPWNEMPDECLPTSTTQLNVICGDIPCIHRGRNVPAEAEYESATQELGVILDIGVDPGFRSLTECAWALLKDNTRLIDYIMCTLLGNSDAGDCIKRKIRHAKPDVRFDNNPNPPALGTVVDMDAGVDGLVIGLGAGIATGNPLLVGVGGIVGFVAGAFTFDDIVIFANDETAQSWLDAWENGSDADRACACLNMAALLLHEISHLCLLNLTDFTKELGPCPVATMLEYSFLWMMVQRYPEAAFGSCCGSYGAVSTWWSTNDVSSC